MEWEASLSGWLIVPIVHLCHPASVAYFALPGENWPLGVDREGQAFQQMSFRNGSDLVLSTSHQTQFQECAERAGLKYGTGGAGGKLKFDGDIPASLAF